jgi:hypothetical protein
LSELPVLWCINYTACTTVILASFGTMKLQTLQEMKIISTFAPSTALLFGAHGKPHQNFSKYNLQTVCGSVTTMFEIEIR